MIVKAIYCEFVDEKSKLCVLSQRGARMLEVPCKPNAQDHLREVLNRIRPTPLSLIKLIWQCFLACNDKQGGTARLI